jgi:hypothetical protein
MAADPRAKSLAAAGSERGPPPVGRGIIGQRPASGMLPGTLLPVTPAIASESLEKVGHKTRPLDRTRWPQVAHPGQAWQGLAR